MLDKHACYVCWGWRTPRPLQRTERRMRRPLLLLVAVFHFGGSALFARQAEGKRQPDSQSWQRGKDEILLKSGNGTTIKRIPLANEEKTLAVHPEHKFTEKKIILTRAGISNDGQFAWVNTQESAWLLSGNKGSLLFRYYDKEGNILWEKTTVTEVGLSDDGRVVGVVEADPKAIEMNEHGNTFGRPSVYSNSGELLLDLRDCKTFSGITLTANGRFGVVTCTEYEPQYRLFHVAFDVKRKLKKRLDEPGVEVHEDGTYAIFDEKQEFNPVTKKYGKFVRKILSHGRIE